MPSSHTVVVPVVSITRRHHLSSTTRQERKASGIENQKWEWASGQKMKPCSKRRRVSVTHDTLAEPRRLQLETLRYWSSREPLQLALQTPLLSPIKWSQCTRVVSRRCNAFPRNNRTRMKTVSTVPEITAVPVRRTLAVKRSDHLSCSLSCMG